MKILLNSTQLKKQLKNDLSLGFVPTMGSLHKGHEYLITRSKKECKKTIVSIFINPTQFNNSKDLKKYPKDLGKDLSILKKLKVNFVFIPKTNDIYKSKKEKRISLNKKDLILCAKYRKGHFEGVIDVMDRLTNLIRPKKIYMGEKDFQQLYLVKKYIEKKYKSKVISCKTIRNSNNLALSSRNLLLKKKELVKAEKLIQNLINFKKKISNKKDINKLIIKKKIQLKLLFDANIEYLELRNILNLG